MRGVQREGAARGCYKRVQRNGVVRGYSRKVWQERLLLENTARQYSERV